MTIIRLPSRKSPHGLAPALRQDRRHQPFYTGKAWVGLLFVPKPIPIDGDAARLQAALLDPDTASRLSLMRRIGLFLKRHLS